MKKIKDMDIFKNEKYYCAFPCISICQNGDLLVVFRVAPREKEDSHLHTQSRAVIIRSIDDGQNWEENFLSIDPDYEYGQQDPHIVVLSDGSIIADYFSWQAHPLTEEESLSDKYMDTSFQAKQTMWRANGVVTLNSNDHGATWKSNGRMTLSNTDRKYWVNAMEHSRIIEMPNGDLIFPCRTEFKSGYAHYLVRSSDRGKTWAYVSEIIRAPVGEKFNYYDEGFLFRCKSGKLICFLRCYDQGGLMEIVESSDDGKTWCDPYITDVWGYPQSAIQISDNRVLLTYGYRRKPFGVRARIINSECTDINESEEIIVYDEGNTADLGYPSAVELNDGTLLVVYYCHDNDGVCYIRGTVIG